MALLNGVWQLHDVDDVEALLRAALSACEFAAGLRPHERDDCVAYLLEVAWESAEQFRPDVGRVSFSTLLTRRARQRAVDWFRRERGRTAWKFAGRVHERRLPQFVGFDGLDEAHPALASNPEASGDSDWRGLLDERGRRRARDYDLLGLEPPPRVA